MSDEDRSDGTAAAGAGAWIDSIADRALRRSARHTLERFGHRMLDDVEEFLFGHVGGADEVLERERSRGSALDRIRRRYEDEEEGERETDDGDGDGDQQDRAAEHRRRRRDRAIAELEQLKRRLAAERAGRDAPDAPTADAGDEGAATDGASPADAADAAPGEEDGGASSRVRRRL